MNRAALTCSGSGFQARACCRALRLDLGELTVYLHWGMEIARVEDSAFGDGGARGRRAHRLSIESPGGTCA